MPRSVDISGRTPRGLLRRSEIQSFQIQGWDGGWQPDLAEVDIQPNALADVQNIDYTEAAGIKKRKGFVRMSDSVTGEDDPSHVFIQPVMTLDANYPRFEQIVLSFNLNDGELYYQSLGELVLEDITPGGGTDLVDSGHSIGDFRPGFNGPRPWGLNVFTFGSVIYVVSQRTGGTSANGVTVQTQTGTNDGQSKPIKFDAQELHDGGTIITRPEIHRLSGGTTGVPGARVALPLYDRVFYGNLFSFGGTDPTYNYRSRIYWSEPGTAETIESTSYVVVGADDDGSDITAMVPFRSQIMVFKIDSVWSLTGTDEDTFSLYKVSNDTGTEATHGVVADEEFLYFFDSTQGVLRYDGVRFENISNPINDTMLADLNRWSVFKTCMWMDDRRLYVSIPVGDIGTEDDDLPTKTYVYDLQLQAWANYTIGFTPGMREYKFDTYITPSSAAAPDGKYYGGVYNKIGVNRLIDTDSDGGTAIDAFAETGWLNPGDMGDKHRLRRLEAMTEPDGDAIGVTLYRDFDQDSWKTGTFTPTGALDGWHEQQDEYSTDFWTWLKVKFANSTDAETFTINSIAANVSTRRILRGERGGLNQ